MKYNKIEIQKNKYFKLLKLINKAINKKESAKKEE